MATTCMLPPLSKDTRGADSSWTQTIKMGSSSRRRQPHLLSQNTIKPRIISRSHEHGWQGSRGVSYLNYRFRQAIGWDAPDEDKRSHTSSHSHPDRRCKPTIAFKIPTSFLTPVIYSSPSNTAKTSHNGNASSSSPALP